MHHSRVPVSVLGTAVGAVCLARTADYEGGAWAQPTVARIPTLTIKRDTSSSVPLRSLDDASLNQPAGRPQGLEWDIVQDKRTGHHYVQSKSNPSERYKAPDGSNWVNGVAHPPFIKQHNWDALKAEMINGNASRPGDIHVVTFPKCGTTFTEQIVLLLLNGGDPSTLNPKQQNRYKKEAPERGGKVWIENTVRVHQKDLEYDPPQKRPDTLTLDEFNGIKPPRVIKTHAPRDLFLATMPFSPPSLSDTSKCRPEPLMPGIKVVYCSRQAKDAVVSAYYHAKNPHRLGFPFDAWVATWMSGLFEHGRWSDHIAGWRAEYLMNPQQVIWLRYEDLVQNPHSEVRRLAEFLQVECTDEVIAKVVENSSFASMKSQAGNSQFFRSGTVGDSARHFSLGFEQEFETALREQMRGVSDPYES